MWVGMILLTRACSWARNPNCAIVQITKPVPKMYFHGMRCVNSSAAEVKTRKMMYIGRMSSSGGR